MPAARPSKASLNNVLAAMKSAGIAIGSVRVLPDGGFRVETVTVAESRAPASNVPSWEDVVEG